MIFSLNLARVVARVKGIVSLWRDSANSIPTHIGLSEPLQMMWPALKLLVDHIQPQKYWFTDWAQRDQLSLS